MNKYENILNMIGKILGFSLFAILAIGLTSFPILIIIFVGSEMLGGMLLLFELCLSCSIHFFSYSMGLFLFGDRYIPTGYVKDGRSLNWPKETYIYVKRNMITNFVEIISCLLFCVVYIVLLCLNLFTTLSICGLIASIIACLIFYLFYKKEHNKLTNNNLNN